MLVDYNAKYIQRELTEEEKDALINLLEENNNSQFYNDVFASLQILMNEIIKENYDQNQFIYKIIESLPNFIIINERLKNLFTYGWKLLVSASSGFWTKKEDDAHRLAASSSILIFDYRSAEAAACGNGIVQHDHAALRVCGMPLRCDRGKEREVAEGLRLAATRKEQQVRIRIASGGTRERMAYALRIAVQPFVEPTFEIEQHRKAG